MDYSTPILVTYRTPDGDIHGGTYWGWTSALAIIPRAIEPCRWFIRYLMEMSVVELTIDLGK